jgi:hypothetical protein
MNVSFFKSALSKNHSLIDTDDFFEYIRLGRWKSEINILRTCLKDSGKEEYNKKKKLLFAVTLSGEFNGRTDLVEYSGLLQGDIDNVKNPELLRDQLSLDPHVRASFLSPSGEGVKLAIKVPEDPDHHTDYFNCAKKYFRENHGVELDNSCKDINRLMFVSHDEDIKGNVDAVPLTWSDNARIEGDDITDAVCETSADDIFFDSTKVFTDPTKSDYEKAEIALKSIFPEEYDVWFKVGCSLKALLGESGYELWNSWSSQSSKYNPSEMRYKWNSISPEGGVSAGTVMQHFVADNNNVFNQQSNTPDHQFSPRAKKEVKEKISTEVVPLDSSMCYPDGLVGNMVRFICENSRYPQPILALSASLTFVGTLIGRKVCTEDDIRPNLFTVGLGRTGIGKESARSIIKKIYSQLEMQGFGAEKVTSRTAIERVLSATPSALFLFDEFGKYVQSILGEKSSGHVRDVMTALMELYSSSATTFFGTDKANARENPRFVISQPHANIYATSTPDSFWEGLTHTAVRDGSLNRFLIFSAVDRTTRQMTGRVREIPQALKEDILRLYNLTENIKISSRGRMYDPTKFIDHHGEVVDSKTRYRNPIHHDFGEITCDPDPMTIGYSDDSLEIFDRFEDITLERADKKNSTASMWVRASEHSKKIALILTASKLLNEIPVEVAMYSTNLVDVLMKNAIKEIATHLSDNFAEKESKRVERIIAEYGEKGVTMSELTQRTRFIKSRQQRKNILEDLYEAELINFESRTSKSGKDTTFYFCE